AVGGACVVGAGLSGRCPGAHGLPLATLGLCTPKAGQHLLDGKLSRRSGHLVLTQRIRPYVSAAVTSARGWGISRRSRIWRPSFSTRRVRARGRTSFKTSRSTAHRG